MFHKHFVLASALAVSAAILLSPTPARAAPHGGHRGGGLSGGFHGGVGHTTFHSGAHLNTFNSGSLFRSTGVGVRPGTYLSFYPSLGYYPNGVYSSFGYGSSPLSLYSYPSYGTFSPYSYYAPGNYYSGTSYPGGSVLAQPTGPVGPPASASQAKITVFVPAGAELWFDGTRMNGSGTVRRFSSPPLQPGRDYTYAVRASWKEDGRTVTQSRQITVNAGFQVPVVFPNTEVPRMPRVP